MCFDFLKFADPVGTPFAAEAALLVAAARRVGAEDRRVDVDRAGAQPARHRHRRRHVGAVDLTGQAVEAVVGDRHGVVEIAVAQHADHRTEDLFLRSRIGVVRQVEHRGLEVVAAVETRGAAAAAEHLAAVLFGQLRRSARTCSRCAALIIGPMIATVGRWARPTLMRAVDRADRLQHFFLAVLRNQHPGGRHAGLAGSASHHRQRADGGAVYRVRQVDLRRLAAEFQRHAASRSALPGRGSCRPATVEPVKDTMSTAGWLVSNSAPACRTRRRRSRRRAAARPHLPPHRRSATRSVSAGSAAESPSCRPSKRE